MSNKKGRIHKIKNFGFDTNTRPVTGSNFANGKGDANRNLANYITPVQLNRLKTDVSMWREGVAEMERAWWPFRVKVQRNLIDTVINGHVYSLMERRKDLTLLRKYKICDEKKVQSDVLTQALEAQEWFFNFQSYALDALGYGYSLISLGDIVANAMQDVTLVPRWHVSPDRLTVSNIIYSTSGKSFVDGPAADWHVYVKTQSDHGVSPCGYGYLYPIALYEIFLRNTLGYNGDFVELYSQPYRLGKTAKTTEPERGDFAQALQNMGSNGWAMIDHDDDIQFLETALGGTGYQGYASLEERCQKTVSKIILGHADAMDSTPGKLGSGQGKGETDGSPVATAMADKQTRDGRFMESLINRQLFPKTNKLGFDFKIPEGYRLEYSNDAQVQQERKKENDSNLQTAQIAQTMSQAGLQMDQKYFTERTGIIATAAPVPEAGTPPLKPTVQNRLKKLYSK